MAKRFISTLLVLMMIMSATGAFAGSGLAGDINGDGRVNSQDVTAIMRYLQNEEGFGDWELDIDESLLDTNGDGDVTFKDEKLLRQYLLGWNVELSGGGASYFSTDGDYGYLIGCEDMYRLGVHYTTIAYIDADGEYQEAQLAAKVRPVVDGISYRAGAVSDSSSDAYKQLVGKFFLDSDFAEVIPQLFKFEKNASDEIRTIYAAYGDSPDKSKFNLGGSYGADEDECYDAAQNVYGNVKFDDNTIVYGVALDKSKLAIYGGLDGEDVYVGAPAEMLINGESYDFDYYDVSGAGIASAVVVYGYEPFKDFVADSPMVVADVSAQLGGVYTISGYQSGAQVAYVIYEDEQEVNITSLLSGFDSLDYAELKGAVIEISTSSEGFVSAINILVPPLDDREMPRLGEVADPENADVIYYFGYVADEDSIRSSSRVELTYDEEISDPIKLSDANIYLVDYTNGSAAVSVSSFASAIKAPHNTSRQRNYFTYVFVKEDDEYPTDAVAYKFTMDYGASPSDYIAQADTASLFGSRASASPTVTVGTVYVSPDTEALEVPVYLSGNTGFCNLSLEISYDTDVLTLGDVYLDDDVTATFTEGQIFSAVPFAFSIDQSVNIDYNGAVVWLYFEVNDGFEDFAPITIDYYKGREGDYVDGEDVNFDENFDAVGFSYEGGGIYFDSEDLFPFSLSAEPYDDGVEFYITHNDKTATGVIIFAQYDESGSLIATSNEVVFETTGYLDVERAEGAATVTAFIWDGIFTMQPMSRRCEAAY